MRRIALLLVTAASFFAVSGVAAAHAPGPVPPHQHFLVLPDGSQLAVGPDICANPAAAQGFYGFHQNIHTGRPGQNGGAFDNASNPVDFTFVFGC